MALHTRRTFALLAFSLMLASCTSLPRYTTATPRFLGPATEPRSSSVAVLFEPIFPGKPLSETTVDNAVGATWNPEEATQIGFTQNYGETLVTRGPQLALLATLPPVLRTGLTASGQAGGFNISSRVMVPIGLFMTQDVQQLLQSRTQNSLICGDLACMDQARRTGSYDSYVVLHVKKLRVAEETTNKLTIEIEAMAEISDATGMTRSQLIRASVKDRSITSEGLFHSDFLKAMNKIANEVSSDFAVQVFRASVGG